MGLKLQASFYDRFRRIRRQAAVTYEQWWVARFSFNVRAAP